MVQSSAHNWSARYGKCGHQGRLFAHTNFAPAGFMGLLIILTRNRLPSRLQPVPWFD
jgi:hypothetical protein